MCEECFSEKEIGPCFLCQLLPIRFSLQWQHTSAQETQRRQKSLNHGLSSPFDKIFSNMTLHYCIKTALVWFLRVATIHVNLYTVDSINCVCAQGGRFESFPRQEMECDGIVYFDCWKKGWGTFQNIHQTTCCMRKYKINGKTYT